MKLTAATEIELIIAAQAGCQRSKTQLITAHQAYVAMVARKRYSSFGIAREDLIAEGTVGLLLALKRFDVTRGVRFLTLASHWVRAVLGVYVLRNRRIVRPPHTRATRHVFGKLRPLQHKLTQDGVPPTIEEIAAALKVRVVDVQLVEDFYNGRDAELNARDFDTLDGAEARFCERDESSKNEARVHAALATLTARERAIITQRYLAQPSDEALITFEVIGKQHDLSRERIRQIEVRAFEKLRKQLDYCGVST